MNDNNNMPSFHATTILAVRRGDDVVMAGDGQVTLSTIVVKHNAHKVRRLYNDKIIVGFAGATADAFTLFERFEGKLEKYNGNLMRAAVELVKDWRTDKFLRRLEALLLAADNEHTLLISGNGDVLEPDQQVAAIGSGGPYAQAAGIALIKNTELDAETIAKKAMEIASEICIYTNNNIIIEKL